jgi:AraC family transcriptional regulator
MAPTSHLLASGPGWRVDDVVCDCGPHDRPFEERHNSVCIAAVTHGSFQYRSTLGSALLAPGTLLLGNDRHSFECSHEYSVGDRCLSFHFTPCFVEDVVAAAPGVRSSTFAKPRLPPLPALLPIVAAAEAARDDGDGTEFEEIAFSLIGAVFGALTESGHNLPSPNRRDGKRISAALRHIEACAEEELSLADLARVAAMSPYHFLRTFNAIAGVTPHQYILLTRLRRVAIKLRRTADGVSDIAFAAGFNDLSTFNRRFRRIMGVSPGAYRAASQLKRGGPSAAPNSGS